MNINTSMMSSSMSKTTGCGGGFLGKTGDEWADIGLTVGGAALATAGVIGIGSLIFDNFGGGGGSSSSSEKKEDKILVVTQDGRVITAQPQEAAPQIPAPKSSQDELNSVLTTLLTKITEKVEQEQKAAAQLPAPQPQPQDQAQPDFVTKADLDRKIEEMTASVTEAVKNAEKAATIRIDDSALEKIAEMVVAKQAGSDAPQPPAQAKKSAK